MVPLADVKADPPFAKLAPAGSATLVAAAYGWGPGIVNGLPLLVELVVLCAATGGVFAAMILGHWYRSEALTLAFSTGLESLL